MIKIKTFIKNQREPFWFSLFAILMLALSTYFKNIFFMLFIIGSFLFAYFTLLIYRINDLLSLLKKSSLGQSIPKEKKKVKKIVEVEVEEE